MSSLPVVSGRKVVAALAKIGYEKDRQKGSHIVLRQAAAPYRRLVVPDHDEVAKGTLRAIIKQRAPFKALDDVTFSVEQGEVLVDRSDKKITYKTVHVGWVSGFIA